MAQQNPRFTSQFGHSGDGDKIMDALRKMQSGDTTGNALRLFQSRADDVLTESARSEGRVSKRQTDCIRAYAWVEPLWVELSRMRDGLMAEDVTKVAPFVSHIEEAYNCLNQMTHAATDTFGGHTQWDFWGSYERLKKSLRAAVEARQKKDF